MSLLLTMLSRLVIAFLPRSKRLLILWLQSPSAVILEPKKIKSVTVSIVFESILKLELPHTLVSNKISSCGKSFEALCSYGLCLPLGKISELLLQELSAGSSSGLLGFSLPVWNFWPSSKME